MRALGGRNEVVMRWRVKEINQIEEKTATKDRKAAEKWHRLPADGLGVLLGKNAKATTQTRRLERVPSEKSAGTRTLE